MTRRRGRWSRAVVAAVVVSVVVTVAGAPRARPAGAAGGRGRVDAAGTVWLCRPGKFPDPCTDPLDTTVVEPDGRRHEVRYPDAAHPAIDCFYVYPNVTHQTTPNADLQVDSQEAAIAQLEASPFSQVCRVFAPMYKEATGAAQGATAQAAATTIAFDSVLDAWRDYLAHDNHGRGVVLLGHSEGAYQLARLLTEDVDRDPAVRARLVSAIVTGVDLPTDRVGFGPLTTIGPCRSETQLGCVVDFNAYATTPPADARFGKFPLAEVAGHPVEDICTDPAALGGGRGPLDSMYRTSLATPDVAGSTSQGIFGGHPPRTRTAWIEYDGGYSARCVTTHGRHVLVVKGTGRVPALSAEPDAAWGLHVDDPNLAMGNLVDLVRTETAAYEGTLDQSSP